MAREAIEDYGRYKLDKASNSQKVQVYDPKTRKFVTKKSSETFLGNILMISENDRIPTDLVLLASDKDDGTAYIETSSLDGEKNLKPKRIAMDMEKIYPYGKDESSGQLNCLGALQTQGSCQAEARNEQLYQFTGRLRLETQGQKITIAQGADQLLLAGAVLRNTKFCVGLVVYTGFDTRAMMNSKTGGKIKQSQIEQLLNYMTFAILLLQCFLCGFITFKSMQFNEDMHAKGEDSDKENPFVDITPVGNIEAAQNFVRYFQVF
jgi:phospholipid-transporting ATPase